MELKCTKCNHTVELSEEDIKGLPDDINLDDHAVICEDCVLEFINEIGFDFQEEQNGVTQ